MTCPLTRDCFLACNLALSVGPLVRELKSGKMSVSVAFCAHVSVLKGGFGGMLGVDGGRLPLPSRPQRYCEPASLVVLIFIDIHAR